MDQPVKDEEISRETGNDEHLNEDKVVKEPNNEQMNDAIPVRDEYPDDDAKQTQEIQGTMEVSGCSQRKARKGAQERIRQWTRILKKT